MTSLVPGLVPAALAAEPAGGSNRYSDSGLLDAARGAATTASSGPVNIGIPPADELRVLEARREAELKRLSEKLKRATEQRGPKPTEVLVTPTWATDVAVAPVESLEPARRSALGAQPSTSPEFGMGAGGRATILMVMSSGDGRARDPSRGADPILCVADGCYVSNGTQAPATYLSFSQSVSLSGRLGRGAGECNHSAVCVFRGVDLGSGPALVQPVNLRFVRLDRREQSQVTVDQTCRVIDGHLSCSRPVRTPSYTMWVVPERMASEIGPELLAAAVNSGLRTAQTAELPWVKQ